MAKSKDTTPYKDALCIMLARDNHTAGFLLFKIVYWSQYGKAQIPGTEGYWIANKREWWWREARLSSGQYNRAISNLESWGLIEKQQFWYGRYLILHVRPTALTIDFLALGTTWEAAIEFLPDNKLAKGQKGPTEITAVANPSSSTSAISLENAGSSNPSLSENANSNTIINTQNISKNIPTIALPASPSCVTDQAPENEKVISGEKKQKKIIGNYPVELEFSSALFHVAPSFTLKQLQLAWKFALNQHYATAVASGKIEITLSAKEVGVLAETNKRFASVLGPGGSVSFQAYAADILIYAVEHWNDLKLDEGVKKTHYPSINSLAGCFNSAVTIWHEAGRPPMPAALKAACGPPAAVPFEAGAT